MQLVEFLIGKEQFPVYRVLSDNEVQVLAALLGRDFRFELEAGEPMDEILLDVLTSVSASSDFYFVPPMDADVFGTFEMRDAVVPQPQMRPRRTRPAPRQRVH